MKKFDFSKCTFNDDKEGPLLVVWLVWVWMPMRGSEKGYFTLRSVSLSERHAEYVKATAKKDIYGCKVNIEKTVAEHFFGANMFHRIDGNEPPDGY